MGKYHISIRVLHWLMALLVIGTIALGFLMDSPNLYGIHKSIGVTLLILLSLRILSRLRTKSPEIPSEIESVERRLAKLGHFALYSLLLLMPVSGWLMSNLLVTLLSCGVWRHSRWLRKTRSSLVLPTRCMNIWLMR